MLEKYLALNKKFMNIKRFGKAINRQSIWLACNDVATSNRGRKKNIFISVILGISAMFFFVFLANAQGVSLPTNVGLPSGNLTSVISRFTNWILGIFGFLAIISFIVSGIMYFLSAGDDKLQEKAKKQMQWSIVGVAIGLIGLVVIYTIDMLLGGGAGMFGGMF